MVSGTTNRNEMPVSSAPQTWYSTIRFWIIIPTNDTTRDKHRNQIGAIGWMFRSGCSEENGFRAPKDVNTNIIRHLYN